MAYSCPRDLDGFAPLLSKQDVRFRQQLGQDLLNFLADPANPITCQDIGLFVDGLVPWIHNSNFKVSSTGIEALTYLVDRLGSDFRPYLQTVLPNIIDRLSDAKDTVREKAQLLILKLLERNVLTPQLLFEKLSTCFTHKNAKIREEVLRCLVNTVNEHGAHSLTLNKFIPDIVKLLSDPTAPVRDTAFNTLVDLYKHVGEKLRADLQRRNLVPQAKWAVLSARFDEVKNSGELLPTASKSVELHFDEPDRMQSAKLPTLKKPMVPSTAGKPKSATSVNPNAGLSRVGSVRKLTTAGTTSGAVDEEFFRRSFEDVPKVQVFSAREVLEQFNSIKSILSDTSKDWNVRVEALKKVRSLVVAGATEFEEFYVGLKSLDIPMESSIKDLRSQVVRETCITIAYLSETFRNRYEKSVEFYMQALINLIQNSAKIMATSGAVALKFIIQNMQSPRLIPIITSNATNHKSKDIRRQCCEFIEMMLTDWPTHTLEKHIAALQECVKKGIADADPEARVSSRRAFRGFRDHFPDQAEALLQSLEPSYRRALQGDGMSASSSNNNLNNFKTPRQQYRPTHTASSSTSDTRKGFRSNSAIDLQAAQRAKARSQYSAMARNKVQMGTASLQGEVAQSARPRKSQEAVTTASPERMGRTRSRNSQSQPTSRSGSPSSRLAYLYHRNTDQESPRPRRLSSGIPRSTQGSRDASRETSPNRGLSRFRRSSDRPPVSPASRPVLAQKILQQSREAENALADAFNESGDNNHYRSPRKSLKSLDHGSDESETSSICSERSFDSYKRPSDNINEILVLCASTNWQERREGLLSLRYYLDKESKLTKGELSHLTEIFTKLFMDSHTKGWSVFLDALSELIKVHKDDLDYWIYMLLQRIFTKIGSEGLTSVHNKLLSTLDLIRVSFPVHLLIANVYKFITDATQTPNSRTKTAVMTFLTQLLNHPDAGQALHPTPHSLKAVQRIITFTEDMKSNELRHAAKVCLVALWNCNISQMTIVLSEFPKDQQDIAYKIIHNHSRRKTSTGSEPGSPMVAGSPKTLSPGTPPCDQEDVYKSLRRTTAEIQNYSFEALGSKLDRDRDTTSQDSGISQMSIGNDHNNRHDMAMLEEKMDELTIRQFSTVNMRSSGPRSLPYTAVNGVTETDSNGCRSLGEIKDAETIVKEVIEKCCIDHTTSLTEKRTMLVCLLDLIKQGDIQHVVANFKKLLRILIDHLLAKDSQSQVIVLKILAAIFQQPKMKDTWENFVELITLKVLKTHSDERKEVVKEAEATSASMAAVCPFETVVCVLGPLIRTSPYPEDLGAIKMLTKLIEANPHEITDEHLQQIMPGILKGTDHVESPVRKSSIFCMVALYRAVGEDRFAHYMNLLTGSKIKLLRLYITRAEQNTSMPTSPKTNASNGNSAPLTSSRTSNRRRRSRQGISPHGISPSRRVELHTGSVC